MLGTYEPHAGRETTPSAAESCPCVTARQPFTELLSTAVTGLHARETTMEFETGSGELTFHGLHPCYRTTTYELSVFSDFYMQSESPGELRTVDSSSAGSDDGKRLSPLSRDALLPIPRWPSQEAEA